MEKKFYQRVVTFLKREELDFLDTVAKDIYFDYGVKIPRGKIIEEIIEAFRDSASIKPKDATEKELLERFKDDGQENSEK